MGKQMTREIDTLKGRQLHILIKMKERESSSKKTQQTMRRKNP